MIYCVWYPSGGFGHFINAVLTLHGENFVRPNKNSLTFSPTGDSHNLVDLVVAKYSHNHWPGGIKFLDDKNYCVLIDNGINDQNDNFKSMFPQAKVIKICYSIHSWPIVARTMIEKAMLSSLEEQLTIDQWDVDQPWARREKYFLFLRDHHLRHAWGESNEPSLDVYTLFDYNNFFTALNSLVEVQHFSKLWTEWRLANATYVNPVDCAKSILSNIAHKQWYDITDISDVWTQAVIYYYIWIQYKVEVPHNDYANWFTNTKEIAIMLKQHGVNIDSN
jgi:hypothetical protein